MFLLSTLFFAHAATPGFEDRSLGIGGSLSVGPAGRTNFDPSLRWQVSPRWALEPSFGVERDKSRFAGLDDQLWRTDQLRVSLSARRVLLSVDRTHLIAQGEVAYGSALSQPLDAEEPISISRSSLATLHTGIGVEWTPLVPLALSADLVLPIAQIQSNRSTGLEPFTTLRLDLSPQVRIATHLYF